MQGSERVRNAAASPLVKHPIMHGHSGPSKAAEGGGRVFGMEEGPASAQWLQPGPPPYPSPP